MNKIIAYGFIISAVLTIMSALSAKPVLPVCEVTLTVLDIGGIGLYVFGIWGAVLLLRKNG